jgi:hypothetical protein
VTVCPAASQIAKKQACQRHKSNKADAGKRYDTRAFKHLLNGYAKGGKRQGNDRAQQNPVAGVFFHFYPGQEKAFFRWKESAIPVSPNGGPEPSTTRRYHKACEIYHILLKNSPSFLRNASALSKRLQ